MQISDASNSEPVVQEPTRFGKYHLIASLGQGGMAKVFLALLAGPSDFNKLLVIKIMRLDVLPGSDEGARMFWAEARLAARLLHPNIVQTHEVGEHGGRCFLAMEYLDGQPLSAILNRARPGRDLPLDELVRVVSEVARGLHYAHQLKDFQGEDLHVVHRDVSPQNVIVTYEGHGKLLDFGIAKTSDGEQTQLGLIKGKLDYIAPEQLLGEHVDARTDVFALGAILWEVVAGTRFAGGRKLTDVQKAQARLVGSERRLRAVQPTVSEELESIVERAIAVAPAERFQDAAALADALDAYLERVSPRPNARVLAGHLARLFASERAELHQLIDRQVKRVKLERSRDGEERPQESSSTDSRKLRSELGLFVSEAHQDERSSIRSAGSTTARASTVAPPRGRRTAVAWAVSSLIVMGSLGFLWLTMGAAHDAPLLSHRTQQLLLPRAGSIGRGPPALPQLAPQSARPSAATPAATDSTVSIGLKVTPPDARVLLDGVRIQLPFEGSFHNDATLHLLVVTANGYRPAKEFVAFDQDKTVEIALQQVHAAARGAGFDFLIERAAQTAERHGETPKSFPSVPATGRGLREREKQSPRLDPVLERPNPYSTD